MSAAQQVVPIPAKTKRRGLSVSPELVKSCVPVDPIAPEQVPQVVGGAAHVGSVVQLEIADLRLDASVQQRVDGCSESVISDYAETIADWQQSAPVVVFLQRADQSAERAILSLDRYWLADGFHRVAAAKQAGLRSVWADVREGGRREAMLYAAGANATHGARRTNADKRRAIRTLLDDIEWGAWSDRAIAEAVGCSHPLVASVRNPGFGQNTKRHQVEDSSTSPQSVDGNPDASLSPSVVGVGPQVRRGKDGKTYPLPAARADGSELAPGAGYSSAEKALLSRFVIRAIDLRISVETSEPISQVVTVAQDCNELVSQLVSLLRDRIDTGAAPVQSVKEQR